VSNARRLTMEAEKYHADPCAVPSLSSSIIHILCSQSALHAWTAHPKLNPAAVQEEAQHFDIGKIAHALLLEGEWIAEVLDFDDWRTNKAKEAREIARLNGKVPILRKHWTDVEAMVQAANIQLTGITSLKRQERQNKRLCGKKKAFICVRDWIGYRIP
jgi:hypothetical protein